jgi:hypothetical protein
MSELEAALVLVAKRWESVEVRRVVTMSSSQPVPPVMTLSAAESRSNREMLERLRRALSRE